MFSRNDQIAKSKGFGSGPILFLEWSAGHSKKATPESFWPHLMARSPAEKTKDVFWSASVPRATMRQRGCHLDSFAGSISTPGEQKWGDFQRTLSRLLRPLMMRHIVSFAVKAFVLIYVVTIFAILPWMPFSRAYKTYFYS